MTEKEKLEILLSLSKEGLKPEDVFVGGIVHGVRIGDFDGDFTYDPENTLASKFKLLPKVKGRRYPTNTVVEAGTVSGIMWQVEVIQLWIDSQKK